LLYRGTITFLTTANDPKVMLNFMKRMDSDSVHLFFDLLTLAGPEVEEKWIDAYNMIDPPTSVYVP
jgi:hypothetical protein